MLDTGHDIVCAPLDGNPASGHCGRVFRVTRIQPVTMVQVRPIHHRVANALHPGTGKPAPARTIGARQTRRLLGGR
jgi:hypothetical protein